MIDLVDRSLVRPDGRVVAWTECGDPEGRVLLRVPGTPGSRYSVRPDDSPWTERGLRAVTTERPGYGASTRLPGRGYREHAADLAAVLDEVSADRAIVEGASGAAPHILAFAAEHPDRVAAATIAVGVAPENDDEIDAMLEVNALGTRLRREGRFDELRDLLDTHRAAMIDDPLAGIKAIMASAPPADQEVMNDPNWQASFARATTEALRPGVEGWFDEVVAFGVYEEIEFERISCSITWWHGEADRNCPISSVRRLLGRLPTARLNVWPDGGHLTRYHHEDELLDELLSRG